MTSPRPSQGADEYSVCVLERGRWSCGGEEELLTVQFGNVYQVINTHAPTQWDRRWKGEFNVQVKFPKSAVPASGVYALPMWPTLPCLLCMLIMMCGPGTGLSPPHLLLRSLFVGLVVVRMSDLTTDLDHGRQRGPLCVRGGSARRPATQKGSAGLDITRRPHDRPPICDELWMRTCRKCNM